jgi:amidohydrolase
MTDYLSEAHDLFEFTQFLRRDFHRHPELGFQETRTSGIVTRELQAMGFEVNTGVGKTGVVALLEGQGPGPVVMLRFDMDALPITEETGAEYASVIPGVMHACGHDGHTAIGLTVARLLMNHRSELAGSVKFVFQPAEEGLGGAEAMIADGVLQNPRPDYALGVHLWNDKPVDTICISDGPLMAASETFEITLTGKGGHGAIPNLAVDPVVGAAQVINALQTIVSRNVSPLETAVVSVTTMKAGDTFNVIPQKVELSGTIRTFLPAVREKVLERFSSIVTKVSEAMNCQSEIKLTSITPAVINDPQVSTCVDETVHQILPGSRLESDFRTMGSEDMAFFMQDIPACFFFYGSANEERGLNAPHHHPRFDFDEAALPKAAALLATATTRLLQR